MSDIPSIPYKIFWEERALKWVANPPRKDGEDVLQLINKIPGQTNVNLYNLGQANKALEDLRNGRIKGADLLVMDC